MLEKKPSMTTSMMRLDAAKFRSLYTPRSRMGSSAVSSRKKNATSAVRASVPEDDDQHRVEPLVALALVEEELEGQEPHHHEHEAGPVHAAGLA